MVHWGDVPTWVAAVGTVLAFAAGGALFWQQRAQLRLMRADLQERERAQRREQARHVLAWYVGVSGGGSNFANLRICYRNASEEPVYEVQVFVKESWGRAPAVKPTKIGVMPPGPEREMVVSFNVVPDPTSDPNAPGPPVVLTFRDVSGRWWRRDEHGTLTEWPSQPDVFAEQTPKPVRAQ